VSTLKAKFTQAVRAARVFERQEPRAAILYPPKVRPPPRPLSLPRFLVSFIRNPLRVLPEAVYHEPIFQYRAGSNKISWVTAPDLIKAVLLDRRDEFPKTPIERRVLGPLFGNGILTSDGGDWRWQRQTVSPLFRHGELLGFVPSMVAAAEAVLGEWRRSAPGTTQRIDQAMAGAAFRVISETVLPGGDTYVRPAIERANADYLLPISWAIAYAILGLPRWLPHPGKRAMRRAEQALRFSLAQLVQARRIAPSARDDLFARLLRAANPETGQPMSNEQLVDNVLTFLSAGHETTARALTWTLYLIARAPSWESRIVEEVGKVAGQAPITAAHIDRLQVVSQVLKESMRLYPPVPVVTRIAKCDVEIGGSRLAGGTLVVMPIYAIHRHRRLWDDPDRFDPDRFAPEHEGRYSRYQFMPFGAGPRICVGASFAMIEATAMLATLVRAARFQVPDGYQPMPISRVTLRPKGGMPLKVWPREIPQS
jgi:cytochrome P450